MAIEDKFPIIDDVKTIKERLKVTSETLAAYTAMNNEDILTFTLKETGLDEPERKWGMYINENPPIFMGDYIKNKMIESLKSDFLTNLEAELETELNDKLIELNG